MCMYCYFCSVRSIVMWVSKTGIHVEKYICINVALKFCKSEQSDWNTVEKCWAFLYAWMLRCACLEIKAYHLHLTVAYVSLHLRSFALSCQLLPRKVCKWNRLYLVTLLSSSPLSLSLSLPVCWRLRSGEEPKSLYTELFFSKNVLKETTRWWQ